MSKFIFLLYSVYALSSVDLELVYKGMKQDPYFEAHVENLNHQFNLISEFVFGRYADQALPITGFIIQLGQGEVSTRYLKLQQNLGDWRFNPYLKYDFSEGAEGSMTFSREF